MVAPAIEDLLYSCLLAEPSERASRLDRCCSDHPALAAQLRQQFERLSRLGLLSDDDHHGESLAHPDVAFPATIGDFEIDGILGRGGMGIVYRGRQPALGDRAVAIKVLAPERVANRRSEARFVREGLLAARLQHPNLCPVLDVGKDEGLVYLAMPLIEGESLASLLRESPHGAPLALPSPTDLQPWQRVVQMGATLARALHAAHEHRLVHRDVKPGNVMIRPDGQPVLLDFGLARDLDDSRRGLTGTLDVVGTPEYMAPEQAAPGDRLPDARTDVFALAATIYECLARRLPRESARGAGLAHRLSTEPVSPIRRHRVDLPRDLEFVLETALELDPERRYRTARSFGEDLERVLEGRPTVARPPGPAGRLARWVNRNPVASGLIGSLFLIAALTAFGAARLLSLSRSLEREGADRQHAQLVARGQAEYWENRHDEALASALEAHAVSGATPEAIGLMMQSLCRMRSILRLRARGRVRGLTSSADGGHLAVTVQGGVEVHSVDDREARAHFVRGARGPATSLVEGGDAICLLDDGCVVRVGGDGQRQWTSQPVVGRAPFAGAASPGLTSWGTGLERRVLVGSNDGDIVTLDAASGDVLDRLHVVPGTVHLIEVFPDGSEGIVAVDTSGGRSSVFAVSLETGRVEQVASERSSMVTRLNTDATGLYTWFNANAWEMGIGVRQPGAPRPPTLEQILGPDHGVPRGARVGGGRLAVIDRDRVCVHGPGLPEVVELLHHATVACVAFDRHDSTLVTATRDGMLARWDVDAGRIDAILAQAPGFEVLGLESTASGRLLQTGSDGTVAVLEDASAPFYRGRFGYGSSSTRVAWDRSGVLLVSVNGSGSAEVHRVRVDGQRYERVACVECPAGSMFLPGPVDSPVLWAPDAVTSTFRTVDPDTGAVLAEVPFPDVAPELRRLAGSTAPDGLTYALIKLDTRNEERRSVLTVFRRNDGTNEWELAWNEVFDGFLVRQPVVLADGRVALICRDGWVRVTDGRTAIRAWRGGSRSLGTACAIPSADAEILGTYTSGELVRIDLETGESAEWPGHATEVNRLVVTGDGRLAASGDATGEVALWRLHDARTISRWRAHPNGLRWLAFSPDGDLLATTSFDSLVSVWPTDAERVVRLARRRAGREIQVGALGD